MIPDKSKDTTNRTPYMKSGKRWSITDVNEHRARSRMSYVLSGGGSFMTYYGCDGYGGYVQNNIWHPHGERPYKWVHLIVDEKHRHLRPVNIISSASDVAGADWTLNFKMSGS